MNEEKKGMVDVEVNVGGKNISKTVIGDGEKRKIVDVDVNVGGNNAADGTEGENKKGFIDIAVNVGGKRGETGENEDAAADDEKVKFNLNLFPKIGNGLLNVAVNVAGKKKKNAEPDA